MSAARAETEALSAMARDAGAGYHPDPTRSYTLASWLYTDAEAFAAERRAIFARAWQCVGHVERLGAPGDRLEGWVLDREVAVVRGDDGTLGAVAAGPDGDAAARAEAFANLVFVNLDFEAAPLADLAGDLEAEIRAYAPDLDDLTFAHRLTYDVAANWKTTIDNFLECYHCPIAHRAFAELVDMASYRVVTHGLWSSHHARAGEHDNAAYDVSAAEVKVHAVWWLWPNTCFLRFPGRGNLMVWRFIPAGPERTREVFDFYLPTPEPDAAERAAIDYIDRVLQPEDIGLVESVQRGLRSRGYRQGRFVVDPDRSGLSEHGVHHFHGLVLEALRG